MLPKDFNIFRKPNPVEPEETIPHYELVKEIEIGNYEYLDFVPPEANTITVEVGCDGDSHTVFVSFLKKKEIKNPNYKKDLKKFNEDQKKLDKWLKYEKIYLSEKDEADKENRKKLYEKLKEEFDG